MSESGVIVRRLRVAILRDLVARGWRPPSRPKLAPHQADRLLDDMRRLGDDHRYRRSLSLTAHERRLLAGLAEGRTARELADAAHVSFESVKSETKQIRRKLGARNTTHAVVIAMRDGLLDRRAA